MTYFIVGDLIRNTRSSTDESWRITYVGETHYEGRSAHTGRGARLDRAILDEHYELVSRKNRPKKRRNLEL